MGTFSQWHTAFTRDGPRRVTWCVGSQRVLVEEVIDTTRTKLAVSPLDSLTFTAGETPDREIWAAANQYPLVPGANRLILVRNAQKIKTWLPLDAWMSRTRELPNVYLLLVSAAEKMEYEQDDDGKRRLKPPASWVKTKGYLVECALPNERDAVAWVCRQVPAMDEKTAGYLLTRVGGNLIMAANLCKKLALFTGNGASPNARVVDVLCSEMPSDSFAELLLLLKHREALHAIEHVPDAEIGRIIGLLDARLELLHSLHQAVLSGVTLRDLKSRTGIERFEAESYWGIARDYDHNHIVYRRKILSVIDDAYRIGVRGGLLEVLTSLW